PPPPSATHTLSLHDALPICSGNSQAPPLRWPHGTGGIVRRAAVIAGAVLLLSLTACASGAPGEGGAVTESTPPTQPASTLYPSRSEEHTSELQSRENLVCRL